MKKQVWVLLSFLVISMTSCHKVNSTEDREIVTDEKSDTDVWETVDPEEKETSHGNDTGTPSNQSTASDSLDIEGSVGTDTETEAELESWVTIPGGSFEMGSEEGKPGVNPLFPNKVATLPIHTVEVPTFQMLRSKVTKSDYASCVDAGICTYDSWYDSQGQPLKCAEEQRSHPDSAPVWCATKNQARNYCTWIGGRLPSEAEWEYAARSAGKPWDYPWGSEPKPSCEYTANSGLYDERGKQVPCPPENEYPLPVCSRPKGNTAQGLCDMLGNGEFEWVEDHWHDDYRGAPNDGTAWMKGPITEENHWPVLRGTETNWTRLTDFYYMGDRTTKKPGLGFRCARSKSN